MSTKLIKPELKVCRNYTVETISWLYEDRYVTWVNYPAIKSLISQFITHQKTENALTLRASQSED